MVAVIVVHVDTVVLVTLFGSYCDDGVSAVIGVQKVTVSFILVTDCI